MSEIICGICLEDVRDKVTMACPDSQEAHPPTCAECLRSHIAIKITDAFYGSCPVIACPCVHSTKKAPLLCYNVWSVPSNGLAIPEVVEKYDKLAKSLLTFLCGNCHKMTSNLVEVIEIQQRESILEEISHHGTCQTENNDSQPILKTLSRVDAGSLSVEEAYVQLVNIYFRTDMLADRDAWDLFKKLLGLISNPERRANLQLRYLRSRPRFWTACCSREHCFRCKTKDFHEGKTCDENISTIDSSMIECPTCNISLVKGDGCNSVTCVCGSQFSWSAEMEVATANRYFLSSYPSQPSRACAELLCTGPAAGTATSMINAAHAWRQRHTLEVNREFLTWWSQRFGQAATQHCANMRSLAPVSSSLTLAAGLISGSILTANNSARGSIFKRDQEWSQHSIPSGESSSCMVEPIRPLPESANPAVEVFFNANTTEVNRRIDDNLLAVKSLFLSMHPNPLERPNAAVRILAPARPWANRTVAKSAFNMSETSTFPRHLLSRLQLSAELWAIDNREAYIKEVSELEARAARCFLCLYGNQHVPIHAVQSVGLSTLMRPRHVWDRTISNTHLEFADEDASVKRPGGISCYPAAFTRVPSQQCSFSVRVQEAAITQNTLSFGLATKAMRPESSDGIGRTSKTWGIHDERGNSSSSIQVSADGRVVASFPRKFQVGDTLTCSVDLHVGKCIISINNDEYCHTFDIPSGDHSEYLFAMTFANDHRVIIVEDPKDFRCTAGVLGLLNMEHEDMFRAYVKRLEKFIASQDTALDSARLASLAAQHLEMNGGIHEQAVLAVHRLMPLISWVTRTPLEVLGDPRYHAIKPAHAVSSSVASTIQKLSINLRKRSGPFAGATTEATEFTNPETEDTPEAAEDPMGNLTGVTITWQELVYAVAFFTLYKEDVKTAKKLAKKLRKKLSKDRLTTMEPTSPRNVKKSVSSKLAAGASEGKKPVWRR